MSQPKKRGPKRNPASRIRPPESVRASSTQEYVSFSFRHIVEHEDYCLHRCEVKLRAGILDHLHKLSKLKWADILQAAASGLGAEKIDQQQLHTKVPAHITQEVPIYVVHTFQKVPVAGYKEDAVFHLVWIDRHFKLYDHG